MPKKKYQQTLEHRAKNRVKKIGSLNPMFGKKPWMFRKHHTKETKAKISLKKKGTLMGDKNSMKREDVKIKHKLAVQKKNRMDWRSNMSKSLKGRLVGGALKPLQVSEKIKLLHKNINSVYHTQNYKLKLSNSQRESWKKNRIFRGQQIENALKKARKLGSKGQNQLFRLVKEKFSDSISNYGVFTGNHWRFIDIFIPSKKIGIEYLGCYWHGCYLHFPSTEKQNETEIRRLEIFQTVKIPIFFVWECEFNNKKGEVLNGI